MSERKLMLERQQKYIDRLKTMQLEVEKDVAIALQKRDCIEADYGDAITSLTKLQENAESTQSLREKDGYTTDDEMVRQDAEDVLSC